MDRTFDEQIEYIIGQLRSAGYEPYVQLRGFVSTLDDRYITRRGNARNLILQLDLKKVKQYIGHMEQ